MRTVNIHAAKTQLSRLVEAAAAGEEIVIARAGKPYVTNAVVDVARPDTDRLRSVVSEYADSELLCAFSSCVMVESKPICVSESKNSLRTGSTTAPATCRS